MTTDLKTLAEKFTADYEGYGISATHSPQTREFSEHIEVNIDGWDALHAYSEADLDNIVNTVNRAQERYYEG